jgi:adenylosuccinate lyase
MHSRLREHSLKAWEALRAGKANPLEQMLAADTALLHFLQPAQIRELLDVRTYLGTAPERARRFAAEIEARFSDHGEEDSRAEEQG